MEDCKSVGKLIGIKVFINEFIAYSELGKIISFRNEMISKNTFNSYKNGTLAIPNDLQMIWNVGLTTYLKHIFCI